MAVELVMPRLSESMEEGTIVSWLVPDGAPVASGQEIAEIETDKATLPYEAPEAGVLRILVPEGTTLPLGSPIGLIDDLPAAVAPPVPRAPAADEYDLPTDAYEVHPDLAAGQPPAAPAAGGQAWSPAWGPQQPVVPAAPPVAPQRPVGAAPQRPVPPPPLQAPAPAPAAPADEGETTEFDALDPAAFEAVPAPAAPAPVAPPATAPAPPAVAPVPPAAAPVPPGAAPAQPTLSDPAGTPWVGTPAPAASGVPVPPAPVPPTQGPPVPPAPVAATPAAAPAPVEPPAAPDDEGRYAAEELLAPPTLAPRPPEQQPAPAAGAPRIVASPVARRLAGELGIDLATLTGTGPEGRIVRADIEAAQAQGAARPPRPASATPSAASEFTPPVDAARAAAPIPVPDPAPAPEPSAQPAPEPELPVEPEPAPAVEPEPAPAVEPESDRVAEPEQTAELAAEPVAELHDASEVAEAEVEAEAEADAAEVVVLAAETARSIDADDEADVEVPTDPEPVAEAAAAPEPEAVPEAAPEATPEPEPEPEPVAEARILSAPQPGGGKGEPEMVELTRQQATVARRMAESKATIPDFHTTVELDAGPLLTLRADLIATRPDLAAPSVNDLIVKAVAIALRAFPRLNGAYKDGRIEQYPRVNVGIATESSGALVVPVIHDADRLSVSQIAARTDELLAKAADGGLRPPDIASATFTVSNLGMHGIDEFTAVITPGQAAILTAGAITARPVVRNGAVVAGQTLRLTLTTDHRAVYGLQAAEFLGRVRQLIEHPSSLLA